MQWRKAQKGDAGNLLLAILASVIVVILLTSFLPVLNSATSNRQQLEDQGYIVLAAGEYAALLAQVNAVKAKTDNLPASPANETTATAAVVNADAAAVLAGNAVNAAVLAAAKAQASLDEWHLANKVYPWLADPVTIPASGVAWTLGAVTEVVPAGAGGITGNFYIHHISISAMSANANFVGVIYSGAGDVEISRFSVTRGGVQIASVIIPVNSAIVASQSRIRVAIADSAGNSTLAVKVHYFNTAA